jgi:sialate O-acetylesterase
VKGIGWHSANLISVEPQGDVMILTFDSRVYPDDRNSIVEGFSIAGEDGKFYMAHARHADQGNNSYWTHGHRTIRVWSSLVDKPVAIRYGWATSPLGNLKCNGHEHMPFPSFRTDTWELPESDDPTVSAITGEVGKQRTADAEARLDERKLKEAEMAKEILERLEALSAPIQDAEKKTDG